MHTHVCICTYVRACIQTYYMNFRLVCFCPLASDGLWKPFHGLMPGAVILHQTPILCAYIIYILHDLAMLCPCDCRNATGSDATFARSCTRVCRGGWLLLRGSNFILCRLQMHSSSTTWAQASMQTVQNWMLVQSSVLIASTMSPARSSRHDA